MLEQDNGKLWPLTESRIVIKSMKKQYSYDILSQPFSPETGFLSSLLPLVQSPFPRASNAARKAVMTPLPQRKEAPVDTDHNEALCVTSLGFISGWSKSAKDRGHLGVATRCSFSLGQVERCSCLLALGVHLSSRHVPLYLW